MFRNILIPLDGSELAESVLTKVKDIIEECKVNSITFIRVIEPMFFGSKQAASTFSKDEIKNLANSQKNNAEEYLNNIVYPLPLDGIQVKTEVVTGWVSQTIIDYANKNDITLMVIATHGRSGVSGLFMGSIAFKIVRSSSIPVLLVRTIASPDNT